MRYPQKLEQTLSHNSSPFTTRKSRGLFLIIDSLLQTVPVEIKISYLRLSSAKTTFRNCALIDFVVAFQLSLDHFNYVLK